MVNIIQTCHLPQLVFETTQSSDASTDKNGANMILLLYKSIGKWNTLMKL